MLLYGSKFIKHPGKLQTHWLGLYLIHSITSGGAIQLQQLDGTVVTADLTTYGESHIYGLPCPSTDSLDPMDQYFTFDVSNIIPKNTYYLLYATFNPFLVYICGY